MVRIGGIETDGTGIGACTVVNKITVVHIHGTAGNTLFAPLRSGGIVVNRTALPAGTVPFKMGTVDGQLIPFVIERTPSRIRCPCGIHCPGSVCRCGTHRTGGVVVEHRVDDLGKTVCLSGTVILIIIDQTQIDRAPAAACNVVDKGAVLYQEGTPHGSFVGCGVVDRDRAAHASCCRVPLKYGTVEFKTPHITGGTERTAALGGCIVDEVAVINTQTAISALDIRTAAGMGFVVLENGTVNNAAVSVDRTAAAIGSICPHGHIRHKHGVVDIQTVSGLIRTVDRTAHAVVRHRFRAGVSIRFRIIDPFTANDIVAEKRTGNGDLGGVLCGNRSAVGILAGFARCGVVIKKHTVLQDVAVFIRIIHTVDGDIAETGTDRRTEGVVAVIIHRTMDELRSRTICRGITVDNDIGIISVDRRTVTGLRSLGVFEYTVGHRQTGAVGKKHHTAVVRSVISLRTGQIDVFKITVADFHIRTIPGSDHTGTAGGTGKIRHSQIVKQHFHAAAHIKQPAGSAAGTAGKSDIGQRCRGSADFGIRGCRVDLHERAVHVLHFARCIFHIQIKEQIVHHQIVTAEIDPAVEHQVGECGIIHRCRGSGIIQREIVSHKIEQTVFVRCRSIAFVVARFDPAELHIRTDRKIVPPEVNDRTIQRCVPAGQPVNGQRSRDRKILSLEINEPALRTVIAARMNLHIGHRNIAVHDQIAVHAFAAGSRKIDHTAQQTVPDRIDRGIAKHRNCAADIFKIKHAAASILHMETFKVIDAGSIGIPDGNIFCTVHIQEAAVSFVVSGIHVCIAGQRNIPVPFIVDGSAGTAAVGTGIRHIPRDPDVVEVGIVDRQIGFDPRVIRHINGSAVAGGTHRSDPADTVHCLCPVVRTELHIIQRQVPGIHINGSALIGNGTLKHGVGDRHCAAGEVDGTALGRSHTLVGILFITEAQIFKHGIGDIQFRAVRGKGPVRRAGGGKGRSKLDGSAQSVVAVPIVEMLKGGIFNIHHRVVVDIGHFLAVFGHHSAFRMVCLHRNGGSTPSAGTGTKIGESDILQIDLFCRGDMQNESAGMILGVTVHTIDIRHFKPRIVGRSFNGHFPVRSFHISHQCAVVLVGSVGSSDADAIAFPDKIIAAEIEGTAFLETTFVPHIADRHGSIAHTVAIRIVQECDRFIGKFHCRIHADGQIISPEPDTAAAVVQFFQTEFRRCHLIRRVPHSKELGKRRFTRNGEIVSVEINTAAVTAEEDLFIFVLSLIQQHFSVTQRHIVHQKIVPAEEDQAAVPVHIFPGIRISGDPDIVHHQIFHTVQQHHAAVTGSRGIGPQHGIFQDQIHIHHTGIRLHIGIHRFVIIEGVDDIIRFFRVILKHQILHGKDAPVRTRIGVAELDPVEFHIHFTVRGSQRKECVIEITRNHKVGVVIVIRVFRVVPFVSDRKALVGNSDTAVQRDGSDRIGNHDLIAAVRFFDRITQRTRHSPVIQ